MSILGMRQWTMDGAYQFVGGGPVTDPFFSSVKLLLGFEGADGAIGSPGMADESSAAHGIAAVTGNAQIDTAQKKFGAASLLLDGSGDYISFSDSADWFLGTGQFTIEGFFRFAAAPNNCILLTQWPNGWAFWFSSGALLFRAYPSADSGSYTWSPSLNAWYHIAIDRDASNVLRIYVEGSMVVKTTGYNGNIPDAAGVPLVLGSLVPAGFGGYDLNGWIDEVRITKGVARYASDSGFAVPTAAYPRS